MNVVRKRIKEKEYYYLEYSYINIRGEAAKKSKYLGKEASADIGALKKKLMYEVYEELWFESFDTIQKNFSKEFKKLPLTARRKYQENFLIKFTYNSNKIEGSTITLKETTRILLEGRSPANKPLRDVKETERHKIVFEQILSEKKDLSLSLIRAWHKNLFLGIDDEIAGKIREHNVGIAGSKFEPPAPNELQYLLRRFMQWYNNSKDKTHPVILCALVHLKFVTIHPFTDGNGRISRLLMNFILHKHNYPMLDIDYLQRNSYYNALEKSQTKNEERHFIVHVAKRYLNAYKKYVD